MTGNREVDIELFIGEVKNFPEIWNVAVETYHDRKKKRAAWISICRVFCDGFDEKDEKDKNEICNKFIQKWKNIKDNYTKSVKKKSKSGQAAEVGKRYIYARQLSFLQTAGATTETQSSLDGELEEPSESEQLISQEESETPPTYTQNSTKKRKRDIETSLIDFINAPIPSSTVPPVSEINPDKSFFESVLPSISNFTEDQKLEFRCEVLNIIKRMRNPPITQNYGYSPGIPYYKPTHDPSYPIAHHSNYLNRPQFPIHSQTRQPTPLSQPQNPNMIFKPISPSSSSSTTIDNQTFTEEDSLDIFRDGI